MCAISSRVRTWGDHYPFAWLAEMKLRDRPISTDTSDLDFPALMAMSDTASLTCIRTTSCYIIPR